MTVCALVLAAGEGSRMKSALPKPLHLVAGRSMLMHVINSLGDLTLTSIVVVVGHRAEQVIEHVNTQAPTWAHICFATQVHQHGTGDATSVGLVALPHNDAATTILVLPGDTPLLTRATISQLITEHELSGHAATILTSVVQDPTGYGRIIRDNDGHVLGIVEQRDATTREVMIKEINTGIYAFRRELLAPCLSKINTNNSQSEYYLTDVIALLETAGHKIGATNAGSSETAGVNDPVQLAEAQRQMQAQLNP